MKNKKKNRTKFKFSKFKVIRNFTVIGVFLIIFFSLKSQAYNEIKYKTIVVTRGQTLWDIAKEEKCKEGYQNKDIRDIVIQIKKINNLTSSKIYENQELKIIDL